MTMIGKSCLVVFSGGQDSTICLFWAIQNFEKVYGITFDYGQRHRKEIYSARRIWNDFVYFSPAVSPGSVNPGIHDLEVYKLPFDVLSSVSPLVDRSTPLEEYGNFEEMQKIIGDRVELTFVPMRNALFLTIAANRAVALGVDHIVTGVCQADGANYPDCRSVFLGYMEDMIAAALNRRLFIHAPLIDMRKSESIKLALTMPNCYQALAYSHTAYDGSYPPRGTDHASVLRAHGFEEVGVPDPLIMRVQWEFGISLPQTSNYDKVRELIRYHHNVNSFLLDVEKEYAK